MSNILESQFEDADPNASDRKKDHISLAFQSRIAPSTLDERFYYEPILSGHPNEQVDIGKTFLGKTFATPIWVSSMTGGTQKAAIINQNLAKACFDFGMGMGLGSCRQLLTDDTYLNDFQVRNTIGSQPLFANLGIAQVMLLLENKQWNLVDELLKKLEADGLIIHVNPLQEWLQTEGDRYYTSPLDVIKRVMNHMDSKKIMVKEVGQGMGLKSLQALLELPLGAIDFGANGGTNFSLLELLRTKEGADHDLKPLVHVGHAAFEMVDMVNQIVDKKLVKVACNELIISGGISDFLDGFYLMKKSRLSSVYGQASGFLKHAMGDYEALYEYVSHQKEGLSIAHTFLSIK
ncbi:MAG: isopentenyl-diphosphate delta-isomerase [Saprospiraceae bacterium]